MIIGFILSIFVSPILWAINGDGIAFEILYYGAITFTVGAMIFAFKSL